MGVFKLVLESLRFPSTLVGSEIQDDLIGISVALHLHGRLWDTRRELYIYSIPN